MQLNEHVSRTQQLQKYLTYKVAFVSEHGKFNVHSKNGKKMQENIGGFSNKLI